MPSRKTLISIVICLVIGLHAVPVLYRSERWTLWPFMQWAMYRNSRSPGPIQAHRRRILAVGSSGAIDTVTPDRVGLSITVLDQRYVRPLSSGDFSAAPELIERLDRQRDDPVVELRVVGETYTVTDTGVARSGVPTVTYRPGPARSR